MSNGELYDVCGWCRDGKHERCSARSFPKCASARCACAHGADAKELARLLPGLHEAIEHYRSPAGTKGALLARACELLHAERERRDANDTAIGQALIRAAEERSAAQNERDAARAHVAELEARLARAEELARELTRERDSEAGRVADLEAERVEADRTIERLSAPSGTRAASLLDAIEEAAHEAERETLDAEAFGLQRAGNIILAHLGEPTPAERVAASALALMPAVMGIDGRPDTAEAACADIARECAENPSRVGFLTMAALAIAGALALGSEEPGK